MLNGYFPSNQQLEKAMAHLMDKAALAISLGVENVQITTEDLKAALYVMERDGHIKFELNP